MLIPSFGHQGFTKDKVKGLEAILSLHASIIGGKSNVVMSLLLVD
jgi:hypothetical protein